MPSRIVAAVVAGQLLLLAGCTGGPSSPSPSAEGSTPASPSAEGTPTPTPASPEPSATASRTPDEQELLDQVRADGTTSVIVEVSLDGAAELNTAERQRLVAEAQDDLIAELDPAHVSVQTRFRNTAQLTLTVDEDGLVALFDSSRVTRVWENESIPLE
ncbi:hypothetical protein [Promicromonospora sp. NPDC023987]|uniref:hypothetical protein n=1 Tax=Promicromonospora sp. NPDC023987 TaxID=3155360 RepID=UPI0033F01FDD